METSQIVRNSAEVLTITKLSPGDVYKRIEATSYDTSLRFGVVQDVMNNGEDSAVTAIEYAANYNSVSTTLKVFDGSQPAAIYPATPDEIAAHFDELEKAAVTAVEAAEATMEKAQAQMRQVLTLRDQLHGLTAPEVTTRETGLSTADGPFEQSGEVQ